MAKFTFKKDPPETGLRSIGHTQGSDIKYKGKVVGRINAPQWSDKHRNHEVRFTVLKSPEELEAHPNSPWKWVVSKIKFPTDKEAREWLKDQDADFMVKNFNIVCTDDY